MAEGHIVAGLDGAGQNIAHWPPSLRRYFQLQLVLQIYIYITEILRYVYWAYEKRRKEKFPKGEPSHRSHPKHPSQVLMHV